MLTVISPSKNLEFKTRSINRNYTLPEFGDEAEQLVEHMRTYSSEDLSSLMGINEELGTLNEERFQNWKRSGRGGKQAILAFRGQVYFGLEAWNFSKEDMTSAKRRLRILSGLYGLLRPSDLIHPYRLEMGLDVSLNGAENLVQYWREKVTAELQETLKGHKKKVLLNLASGEYSEAIDQKALGFKVITAKFLDEHRGDYRFMSFYGKKARGLMARYVIQNRVETVAKLKNFDLEGYAYDPDRSNSNELVFVRAAENVRRVSEA